MRSLALAALLILAGLPARAQPAPAAPVTPMRPPPLTLVCAVGPAAADFCPLTAATEGGRPCTCPGPSGPRQGRAELR